MKIAIRSTYIHNNAYMAHILNFKQLFDSSTDKSCVYKTVSEDDDNNSESYYDIMHWCLYACVHHNNHPDELYCEYYIYQL